MASSNPSNFANLPKDELKEIAAKGGHASHGSSNTSNEEPTAQYGRNPDGTFTKGSDAAKYYGAQGGHASHGDHTQTEQSTSGGDSGVSQT
jgi:general stress protein YciG